LRAGNLSQNVGGFLSSSIDDGKNGSTLVVTTMIAGMQLSNSVGLNDYVDVTTYLSGTVAGGSTAANGTLVHYVVSVEKNNLLT